MCARFKPYRPLRRKVAIRRDGEDFVIAFQPDDIVVFRHAEATALRRACVVLRWEVVSDTVADSPRQLRKHHDGCRLHHT